MRLRAHDKWLEEKRDVFIAEMVAIQDPNYIGEYAAKLREKWLRPGVRPSRHFEAPDMDPSEDPNQTPKTKIMIFFMHSSPGAIPDAACFSPLHATVF